MPSIRAIAKQAGVSIATVSRVLNNMPSVGAKARAKVLSAANRERYVPSVGRRSTTNIALLYTDEPTPGARFDAGIVHGLSRGMAPDRYDLLILSAASARRPQETFTQMFLRKGVRGAVIRATGRTLDVCRLIAQEGFPAVLIGSPQPPPPHPEGVWPPEGVRLPAITTDNRAAVRQAIDHLSHLGHSRVGLVLVGDDATSHRSLLTAYRDAVSAAGQMVDDRLVLRLPAGAGDEVGGQVLRQVLGMTRRPTAVLVTDPEASVGLLRQALQLGVKIPDGLSVVGFDHSDLRLATYPKLSAVCHSAEALGRRAYARLQQLMARRAVETAPLECWLELHDTTAPPPSPPAA